MANWIERLLGWNGRWEGATGGAYIWAVLVLLCGISGMANRMGRLLGWSGLRESATSGAYI